MDGISKAFYHLLWLSLLLLVFHCTTKDPLPQADPDHGGLLLPDGFGALVVVDSTGRGRHLAVNDNGDIYVKLRYAVRQCNAISPISDR
ncbi:MAG: hypothetical protein WDZ72_09120 [Cyclobacteriaceae bacterium]